jgi:hypothetical protein
MVWSPFALRWIAVAWQDDLGPKFLNPEHGCVKVFYFKPQQDTIATNQFRIPNAPVMMLSLPTVQLHEQFTIRNQLFVMAASMATLTTEQTLVPATAGFDIPNTNQGLWAHMLIGGALVILPSAEVRNNALVRSKTAILK